MCAMRSKRLQIDGLTLDTMDLFIDQQSHRQVELEESMDRLTQHGGCSLMVKGVSTRAGLPELKS